MPRPKTAFALTVCVFCALYLFFSLKIEFGGMAEPQAGFMPVLVGVMGLAASLLVLLSSFRSGREHKTAAMPREGMLRLVGCVAACIVFIPIFKYAGAMAGIFFIVITLTKLLGSTGWKYPVFLAMVSSVTAYVVFYMLLDVPLPRGFL